MEAFYYNQKNALTDLLKLESVGVSTNFHLRAHMESIFLHIGQGHRRYYPGLEILILPKLSYHGTIENVNGTWPCPAK